MATTNASTNQQTSEVGKKPSSLAAFIIRKHPVSKSYFELLLEVNGVYKTWLVPRGFASSPCIKRLAVQTKDHPKAHVEAAHHGLPVKHPPASIVVWDEGTYRCSNQLKTSLHKHCVSSGLEKGLLTVKFFGKKVKGLYALSKMEGNEWLLQQLNNFTGKSEHQPPAKENASTPAQNQL